MHGQEAGLLSPATAGKVLEVDDWADAQTAVREETARPLLESCLDSCRLVHTRSAAVLIL